jgi:hypothetical protein
MNPSLSLSLLLFYLDFIEIYSKEKSKIKNDKLEDRILQDLDFFFFKLESERMRGKDFCIFFL